MFDHKLYKMFSPFSSTTTKPGTGSSGLSPFGTPLAGSSSAPQFGGSTFFSGTPSASSIPPFSTPNIPYQPSKDIEGNISITIHSISAMPNYLGKSYEEIRLEDYALGRKGKSSTFPSAQSGYLLGQSQTSGVGGLSPSYATTATTAPSTSMFGQTQQQPQPSGLFGSSSGGMFGSTPSTAYTQPQQQQPAGFGSTTGGFGTSAGGYGGTAGMGYGSTAGASGTSGFGGGTTTSLFGQPQQPSTSGFTYGQQQQPQQQPTSSMFGQPQQQQQQSSLFGTQPSSGMFGSAPTSAPSVGGGLFGQQQSGSSGATAYGGSTFGASKPPTQTSLFGTPSSYAPTSTTSLFGGQPPSGTSAFGAPPATTQPSAMTPSFGTSLFKPAEAPQPSTSATGLFGTSTQPSASGLFAPRTTAPLFTTPSSATTQPQQPFSFGPTVATTAPYSQLPTRSPQLGGIAPAGALPMIAPPPELLSIAPPIHPSLRSTMKAAYFQPSMEILTTAQQPTQITQPFQQQPVEKLIPKITGSIVPATRKVSDIKKLVITQALQPEEELHGRVEPEEALKIGDFYMEPSESVLRKMSQSQLKSIEGFTIGQKGLGEIRFIKPVDLNDVDLDRIFIDIVKFEPKQVVVYPETEEGKGVAKPPPGQGLNQPAIVKLERCWPTARGTRTPITDPASERMKHHIDRLKNVPDTHLLSFDHISGIWEFRVDHFSKYEMYPDQNEDCISSEVQ